MTEDIPDGSPIYIRYKKETGDSVLWETMGWLTKKAGGYTFIEHTRTVESLLAPSGFGKGIIVHDSCISKKQRIEIKGEKAETGETGQ